MNAPRGVTSASDEPALAYALRWRTRSVVPGAHRGFEQGRGGRFRQIVPFDRSPDPRRLDLRASARDPFGRLHVRQYEERATASVFVLTDTSASMAFGLRVSAAQRAADVHAALARAAYGIGDAFGGAAGAESIQWRQPPRRRGYASCPGPLPARGRHLQGLVQEARGLGTRRRLVFVISDFEFPEICTIELLEALEVHDVVPIVIGDHLDRDLPRWGLAELADLESGAKRLVFLRPSLHARWRRERAERRALLSGLFAARGRRPFFLDGALDLRSLADHLLDE